MSTFLAWLFKFMMPFLRFLAPSFCGSDGKASGRKISAFVFMLMILSTTSKILMKDNPTMIHVYLLLVLVTTFLLLQGIITVQNIIDLWRNGKPENK